MTKDEYYLAIAQVVAAKSKCLKKHYGAIIVKDDEIIATGYNGTCRGEPECTYCTKILANKDEAEYATCPAVHAEQNAIISAARRDMLGSTLYLSGFDTEASQYIAAMPCNICLRLIKNAGIAKIVNSTGVIYARDANGLLVKN